MVVSISAWNNIWWLYTKMRSTARYASHSTRQKPEKDRISKKTRKLDLKIQKKRSDDVF